MKLLLALALVAVAHADQVRVVRLPEARSLYTRPTMGQVIIPNYVIDAADVPIMRNAQDDELKVRIVDAPFSAPSDSVVVVEPKLPAPESVVVVETNEEFSIPQPVKLGEAPAPAFETVDAVKLVDAPIAVESVRIAVPESVEAIIPEPVRIAEAPLPVVETKVDAVRVAEAPSDIPVPEPVRIAEAPLPVVEAAPEAVKVAIPEFGDYRGKIFDDPMWR